MKFDLVRSVIAGGSSVITTTMRRQPTARSIALDVTDNSPRP
jgi:hypothetical protein